MKNMTIILAGKGKLAAAISTSCIAAGVRCVGYEYDMKLPRGANSLKTVAIHAGSGRQLRRLVPFCRKHGITLIQASGGMESRLPKNPKIPIVDAPNLAIGVVGLMRTLIPFKRHLGQYGFRPEGIKETHQATKKTVPATARKFAEILGLGEADITSVRNDEEALRLGVDPVHLAGHGHHFLHFAGRDGVQIEVACRVNGRRAYGEGAVTLAQSCLSVTLSPRPYTVEGILDLTGAA